MIQASLRTLQRQTSKIASDAAGARQEWLRQIRPYFIIDMMTLGGHIDKIKRLGEELHNFLIGRGSLLRSLEELNEKLDALSKLTLSRQTPPLRDSLLNRELKRLMKRTRNYVQRLRRSATTRE